LIGRFAQEFRCVADQAGAERVAGRLLERSEVHLEQQCGSTIGEPGDEVQLPQRPVPIERAAVDPGDEIGQRVRIVGIRHGDVAEVVVEIEPGMITPPRTIEVERHLDERLAKHRMVVEPGTDLLAQQRGVEPMGCSRGVDDGERRGVPQRRRRFDGQQTRVAA
jgi:hypothetical protein